MPKKSTPSTAATLQTPTRPRYWDIQHDHRHGESHYTVKCKTEPSEAAVVKACNIDFEPDREEFILITEIKIHELDADMDTLENEEISATEKRSARVLKVLFTPGKHMPPPTSCDGTAHNPHVKYHSTKRLKPSTQRRIAKGVKKYINNKK